MQNQFLYPGLGLLLRTAGSSTANKPNDDTTLANNEYSESVAAHDGGILLFGFVFALSATGTMDIERSSDPSFATVELHATVTITSSLFQSWAATGPLLGYYRVHNKSGQVASIYCNKQLT